MKVSNNARKRILLSHSLIASALAGRGGVRVSVLGRESRSRIHAETEINSCIRVDVRLK
jgi:hypothetical protein